MMIGLDDKALTGVEPKIKREKAMHTLSDVRLPQDPGYMKPPVKKAQKRNAESGNNKQEK